MNRPLKIGVQNVHPDEILTLRELFSDPGCTVYTWHQHAFDPAELRSCDALVLFARSHWTYTTLGIPYLLVLADFVTNQKAVVLSQTRLPGLLGWRYRENANFRGYLCGSTELLAAIRSAGLPGAFYPKRYAYADAFRALQAQPPGPEPRRIVTLINKYQHTAAKWKWRRPEDSYRAFRHVVEHVPGFEFVHYGSPDNEVTLDQAIAIQHAARYTIHLKYWGHVCNAVVKSLALGTPVLMDRATFEKGRYQAYLRPGENGLVLEDKAEAVRYLTGAGEAETWRRLKATCVAEAPRWHFPYDPEQRSGWRALLT